MDNSDDFRLLRNRLDDRLEAADRERPARSTPPRFVGRIFDGGGYVAGTDRVVYTHPLTTGFNDTEGALPTDMVDVGLVVPVLVIGATPAVGANVIAELVDGVWVASKGSGGGGGEDFVSLPGCSCSPIPTHLTMTSFDPLCNNSMFQSCHINYRVLPPELVALGLGSSAFLSVETFVDPTTGDTFYYYFSCLGLKFSLTRVYPTSIFGSPFREGELYYWTVGISGNVCSPFKLHTGTAFSGSDLSCHNEIDPT